MLKNFGSWNCLKSYSLILIIAAAGAALCTIAALVGFFIIGIFVVPLLILGAVFLVAGMIVQTLFIKFLICMCCVPRYYCCRCPQPVYEKSEPPAENDCGKSEQPVEYTQGAV